MSLVETPATTQAALTDAYLTLQNSAQGPGTFEKTLDKLGNAISGAEDSPATTFLNKFYTDNNALITAAADGISSLDNKTIDAAITGFSESVKVVMNGLDALGAVHPFVGVAVVAFKLVVTLDLTRRGNNKKVLAVKVQMQQMMCTLFQLRRIRDPDEVGPNGIVLKDRMQPLMEQIAHDIKECGSACDVYLKKSFIAKTLKSKVYENRLAGYATKFMDYKEELDKALTVHIALGVDAANEKLDNQSTKLDDIQQKLDLLTNVFRKLDTPREREVMDFIQESGGPQAVVERNDLVQALVKKSGESLSHVSNKARTAGKSEIDAARETLEKEFTEDLDAVLKKNFTHFDHKLKIQERNIIDVVERQGQFILSALSAGAHEKIIDVDLQALWREMDWKGSVKARHFVLALRDYFMDKFSTTTPPTNGLVPQLHSPQEKFISLNHPFMMLPTSQPVLHHGDAWALQYINVTYLGTISEVIDDDGTGFISIKEANNFADERPKGWGLLPWIAFWAKGWETSVADYKNRIILILRQMDRLYHNVLPENRRFVDMYLSDSAILDTHLILKSTKTEREHEAIAPELLTITREYTIAEEERIKLNLQNMDYDLDNTTTVTLVTGPGRIGRYLYPLLYLVLKRHLEVFHYARKHVVQDDEFSGMTASLECIFDVVKLRIDHLRAISKQARMDFIAHLENFALGMFHDLELCSSDARTAYNYGPDPSLFMSWEDTSLSKNEVSEDELCEAPDTTEPIFSSEAPVEIGVSKQLLQWPHHSFDADPFSDSMDGFWAGHLWVSRASSPTPSLLFGLTQLKIIFDPADEGALQGHAITYADSYEGHGRRRIVGGAREFDLLLRQTKRGGSSIRLVGRFAEKSETLEGNWTFIRKEQAEKDFSHDPFCLHHHHDNLSPPPQETKSPGSSTGADVTQIEAPRVRKFIFRRTPVEVAGFHPLPHEGLGNDAKSRWSFLRQAILHLVQSRLWFSGKILSQCHDRGVFLDLFTRKRLRLIGFSIPNPLGPDDRYMQPYAFSWYIQEARSMTGRLKRAFADVSDELQDDKLGLVEAPVSPSEKHPELQCGGCTKPVGVPCWACITCATDVLLCDDCEAKGNIKLNDPYQASLHHPEHPLLRLHNVLSEHFEHEKMDSTAARITELEDIVGSGGGGSSVVDGMKLVVLGGTVETARRVSSSAWSHFVNSFFLTAHFSEEDYPFDWLMLWLSRRPEWQRSREFETTTRTSGPGGSTGVDGWEEEEAEYEESEFDPEGRPKTRVVFQPTLDTTHTIFYRGHWLRVRRGRKPSDNCEQLSISVVARSNTILKQLVLQAKREYEAEAVHRIQIYFADSHGSWRWTDSRHKRPMASIVLNPGVKEMLLEDTKDFLRSEKWYADRGIPFRRGYLLHGVPGSGKSSLIHALAGALQLDIYVVSLSASWISDSTLTTLMGRVPARCVVLLEDLDAAFTRSTSRDGSNMDSDKDKEKKDGENGDKSNNSGPSSSRRRRDQLSDVNTLSLSGLLNALDGVAAAEGRLLFATTNHLERLDPALSRPGRMDVWIEFRNASKWQAEALFRNFFPCAEDEPPIDEADLESVDVKVEPQPSSSLWSLASSLSPFPIPGADLLRSPNIPSPLPLTSSPLLPLVPAHADTPPPTGSNNATMARFLESEQFGASNTAYRPPPPAENVVNSRHSAAPIDKKTLNELAKKFADGIPEEEFSVAALQGYLLKNKSQPEKAAEGVVEWVEKERQMRERLKKEKEARELRDKAARERRRKANAAKDKEERELKKKEAELEKVKQRLAEKEKEEELERMRQQLREKEEERKKKEAERLAQEAEKQNASDGSTAAAVVPEVEKEKAEVSGEVDNEGDASDDEDLPPSSSSEWNDDVITSSFILVPSFSTNDTDNSNPRTDSIMDTSSAIVDTTFLPPPTSPNHSIPTSPETSTTPATEPSTTTTDTTTTSTCTSSSTPLALVRRHEAGYALVPSAVATMPFTRFDLLQIYILQVYALMLQLVGSQFGV
ncbi:hypothetical protein NP233_g2617 [Leucocoprinus birnbaumii]|uniref:Mitochondrial chaperone BCS1 n=1 Tax=Leucocoprinus birnbaumii TaxID=56174 RepID=A0AAD5YYX8_9AGAR|nr:hypothetical protein NP233_g2617 [Leucocoprinus birnbaumii]